MDAENRNRLIITNEISQSPKKRKAPNQMALLLNFTSPLEKDKHQIFSN
jgi:hypothetical protein